MAKKIAIPQQKEKGEAEIIIEKWSGLPNATLNEQIEAVRKRLHTFAEIRILCKNSY